MKNSSVRGAIKYLKRYYKKPCEDSDLDDFAEMYKKGKLSENIAHSGRCWNCRVWEAIRTLEKHVELSKPN